MVTLTIHKTLNANAQRCLLGVAAGTLALWLGQGAAWAASEFPATTSLTAINGVIGLRFNGAAGLDEAGKAMSRVGDFNGDGLNDFVVGAPRTDNGVSDAGSAYVIFGTSVGFGPSTNLASLNGSNGFRFDGSGVFFVAGRSVAAGDVNGDGLADVIIGSPYAEVNSQAYTGSTYVIYGRPGAGPSSVSVSSLNGSNGLRIDGVAADDITGKAVAAGDVNGDGVDDVIIGAPSADPGGNTFAGSVYVVFGKRTGLGSALSLSSLNGTTGFRLDGVHARDETGFSVASGRDINGDGTDDVVIGAPQRDGDPGYDKGAAFVVFGKKTAFNSVISLASLNGTSGFRLNGLAAGDRAGYAVGAAGDVNGDGFADFVMGAPKNSTAAGGAGAGYVVFGSSAAFSSVADVSILSGGNGFRILGKDIGDNLGKSVSISSDLNGDGFDDVSLGAYGVDVSTGGYGAAYVVFGLASGTPTSRNVSDLTGANGFRLVGTATDEYTGTSIAGLGDFNGDGFGDVATGGPGANTFTGVAYMFFGRKPNEAALRTGAAAHQVINGGDFADELYGADGNDILEGNGLGDIIDGGPGSDTASYAHAPSPVVANLSSPVANTGHAAGDSYALIENLEGSGFADTLTGNGSANRMTGGRGADKLRGGGGKDIFVLRRTSESPAGSGRDVIFDFKPGTASTYIDKIDLSAIDAKTGVFGNQSFSFIGTRAFSNKKGQLRLKLSSGSLIVQGDTNGNGTADFEIKLKGLSSVSAITAKDFKL